MDDTTYEASSTAALTVRWGPIKTPSKLSATYRQVRAGYAYDSKKSGGFTSSHLRWGQPHRSTW